MNKSEIELQNITSIINDMPEAERETCRAMVASLMASIGNPIHGQTFMIAVAYTNCQVAVHNIKMGLVNEDGSIPAKFMQGDGRVKFANDGFVKAEATELAGERASETVVSRGTLTTMTTEFKNRPNKNTEE